MIWYTELNLLILFAGFWCKFRTFQVWCHRKLWTRHKRRKGRSACQLWKQSPAHNKLISVSILQAKEGTLVADLPYICTTGNTYLPVSCLGRFLFLVCICHKCTFGMQKLLLVAMEEILCDLYILLQNLHHCVLIASCLYSPYKLASCYTGVSVVQW